MAWAAENQWWKKLDGKKEVTDADYAEALDCIDRELGDPRNRLLKNEHVQHIMEARYDVYLRKLKGKHDDEVLFQIEREIAALDPTTFWGIGATGYLGMYHRTPDPFLVYGWEGARQLRPGAQTWKIGDTAYFFDHAGRYKVTMICNGGSDAFKIKRLALLDAAAVLAEARPAAGKEEVAPGKPVEVVLDCGGWRGPRVRVPGRVRGPGRPSQQQRRLRRGAVAGRRVIAEITTHEPIHCLRPTDRSGHCRRQRRASGHPPHHAGPDAGRLYVGGPSSRRADAEYRRPGARGRFVPPQLLDGAVVHPGPLCLADRAVAAGQRRGGVQIAADYHAHAARGARRSRIRHRAGGRNMHQDPPNASVGYQREILGSTYVNDDDYDRYLKQAAPRSGGISALVRRTGVTLNWWQANPWPLDDELHPTAWTARMAEKVVAETPAGRPLFLTASFYSPHPPLFAPKKYFDLLLGQALPKPAHGDWVDWDKLAPEGNGNARNRVLLAGEPLRRAQAGYYGLIEQLDAEVAPLIAAFKARSEKAGRPWLIVFTSDHGEMLGDHGYFRKCEPYEGAANVPFIITGSTGLGFNPGVRGHQLAALEDIMPTLLALAGVKGPPAMDGVNLLPALRGDGRPTRDTLHLEHAPCYTAQQAFQALTDGHVKYIWRPHDGTEQFFDLDADAREERDLSKTPAHRKRLLEWRRRLIGQLADCAEGFSDGKRLIAGRPYRPIVEGKARSK